MLVYLALTPCSGGLVLPDMTSRNKGGVVAQLQCQRNVQAVSG